MTPREREIRERLEKATPLRTDSEMNFYIPMTGYGGITLIDQKRYDAPMTRVDIEFYNSSFGDIRYLLAQLTQARAIIEVAKGAITDNRNHWHHIDADPNGKCTACNALAKITEMEKEK